MRGVGIAAFMIAFILAVFTLSAAGWYAEAGVTMPGGEHKATVEETVGDIEQPEISRSNPDDIGFIGAILGAFDALFSLTKITYKAASILESYGIHSAVAWSIQIMIDLTMAVTLLSVLIQYDVIGS